MLISVKETKYYVVYSVRSRLSHSEQGFSYAFPFGTPRLRGGVQDLPKFREAED